MNRSHPASTIAVLAAVLATISACASRTSSTEDESPSHLASALCRTADITDTSKAEADRVCSTSWRYEKYSSPCTLNKADPRCGIASYPQKTCIGYYTCANPKFNVAYRTTQTKNSSVKGTPVKQRKCEIVDGTRICTDEIVGYKYDAACATRGKFERDAVAASYPTEEAGNIGYTYQPAAQSKNEYGNCSVTVTGIPVWNQKAEAPCPSYQYSCADTEHPNYKTCGVPNSTPQECPLTTTSSRFGYSRNALWDSDPLVYNLTGSAASNGPNCLSCEPLPAGTAEEVAAKYACLSSNYDTVTAMAESADRTAILGKIVANMKLLAELKGGLLTTSALDHIVSLYGNAPTDLPACNTQAPTELPAPSDACGDLAAQSALNDKLDFCQRLGQQTDEPPAADVDADWGPWGYCMQTASAIAAMPQTGCQRDRYEAAFDSMSTALLAKRWAVSLPSIATPPPVNGVAAPEFEAEVQKRIRYLGSWNDAAGLIYRERNPSGLMARASANVAALWQSVEDKTLHDVPALNADGSPTPVSTTILDQVTADALTGDRKIFSALYTTDPKIARVPATDEVLLLLTADVLESWRSRIADISDIHDMACLFTSCANRTLGTSVSASWQAMASVFDDTPGGANLALVGNSALDSGWKSAVANLRTNHAALTGAISRATGKPFSQAFLVSAYADQLPVSVRPLARVVQIAAARNRNYREQHLFDPSLLSSVKGGLNDARQNALFGLIDGARADLTSAISAYKVQRQQLVEDIVTDLRNGNTASQLASTLAVKNQQATTIVDRLGGLRRSAALDSVKYGDFMKSFAEVVAGDSLGADAKVAVSTVAINVYPSASRYGGGMGMRLDQIAVAQSEGALKITGDKGDFLNVTTAGTWSPTCALRRSPEFGPNLSPNSPLIGPEGFLLSQVDGTYRTVSQQDAKGTSTSSSTATSASICAGVRGSAGFNSVIFGGSQAFVDISGCWRHETGASEQESSNSITNQSTESRQSATFASGIRLTETPFPNYPAGALLLVGVARGHTDFASIKTVRTLTSPTTSVVVDQALDFYLIVNDIAGCGTSLDQGALTVTATHLVPAGALARQLGQAMADTLVDLRHQSSLLEEQNGVLPSQPALLRSSALNRLLAACNYCQLSSYPQSFLDLFNAFVDAELVRLERTAALRDAENALRQITMEAEQIDTDLVANDRVSRLHRLLPAWRARDIDAERIQTPLRLLVDLLGRNLYPLASARYPSELSEASLDRSTTDAAKKLLDHPWSDATVDIAQDLDGLANALVGRYRPSVTRTETLQMRVAVSFPNPEPLYPAPPSPFSSVDEARAKAVWDALRSNQPAFLTIRPEDLYVLNGGPGRLPCNVRAPVLRGMTLFLAGVDDTVASTLNSLAYTSSIFAGTDMLMTNDDGVRLYEQLDGQTMNGIISTKFGPTVSAFVNSEGQVTSLPGLSPFGSFRVNPTLASSFGNPLTEATALVLVMDVDVRMSPTSSTRMPGVSTCPQ